ncbi:MAG TPA: hypothetical protein VMT53_05060 [Terriglobales bacterium]|nr:hypothetical protein [Terriglobales bacterium]
MAQIYSRLAPALLPTTEFVLLLCTVAFVFLRSRRPSKAAWEERLEEKLGQFSRRKRLAVFAVGASVIVIRALLIPVIGIPQPRWNDEFSFLLAADTFAHGRTSNPTHPLWTHFETLHVIQRPTYMSMYAPGQGLVLALGQKFGNPWIGQLLMTALMCSALCWMLQAWVPPPWALYGGALSVLRLGILGYWVNTYWCASVSALGGVLLVGAWPRIRRTMGLRDALLMAVGLVILANTRPFEGFVFSLPFLGAMLVWVLGRQRPDMQLWLSRVALSMMIVLIAGAAATGYYYYRVTGSPLRMTYKVNRETYAMAPYFVWGRARPQPEYRSALMREFYQNEMAEFRQNSTFRGYLFRLGQKLLAWWQFYVGPLLTIPLLTVPCWARQRRMRLPLVLLAVTTIAIAVQTFMLPHYFAPALGVLYLFVVQGLRRLARWFPLGRPLGRDIVRAIPVLVSAMVVFRVGAILAHVPMEPAWYREPERSQVATRLRGMPGPQLVFVHFGPGADYGRDWVYNDADIDSAKIVWANDLGSRANRELINYFHDRTLWLANVGGTHISVEPYLVGSSQGQ